MSITTFKTEVNGVKTLADLGMQYATETSKHRVRMAYFECTLCKAAYKSIYYRPAKHCKTCQNMLQKTKTNEKFSIPIGTVFSRLTVLEETAPKLIEGGGSRKCYKVRCECGKTFTTIGTSLKHKRVTECSSCAYQKRPQSTKRLTQEERMFTKTIVERCKTHNIPYSITATDYITTAKKVCHYCGTPPVIKGAHMTRHAETPIPVNGIDRVNNTLGYTIENIVPCCSLCNSMKSTLSSESFLAHIKQIILHLNV
ncbi:MAG: hypothetical protein EOM36_02595 [Bacteroidia bacterium]|nr:hypothetical protein [Bacteroidia bacterium]